MIKFVFLSFVASASLSQAVFETNLQTMSQSDLSTFQTTFGLPKQAAVLVNTTNNAACNAGRCTEGNLDIQYIMGIAQKAQGLYWYTNGTKLGLATDDPFVEFLILVAASRNPPSTVSISWGSIEQYNSPFYTTAFNNEAMKLGLRGVTIFVSSGDNGVASTSCACSTSSSSASAGSWTGVGTWTGSGYFPSYPATSPFVVAVGATQGPQAGGPEIAAQVSRFVYIHAFSFIYAVCYV